MAFGAGCCVVSVLVINLDRDVDRLEHMRTQLTAVGVAFERFPALRGDALPIALQAYFEPGAKLTAGEIGCYASHLAILQKMVSGDIASPALVLEDDLGIGAGFGAVLAALLAKLPPGWDFVRLSNQPRWAIKRVRDIDGYSLCRYSEVPGSTGASLVSLSGARKFLAGGARRFPVDQDLRRPWAWGLDMYGVAPAPITPDVLPQSSISSVSPSTRARLRQQASAVRRQRLVEVWGRHALRMSEFGVGGWTRSVALNVIASFIPKRRRTDFVLRHALVKSHAERA